MLYRLRLTPRAQRSFRILPEGLRSEVAEILTDLREDPTLAGSKSGKPGRELANRRIIRVDGLRIVYQVNEEDQNVVILAIRPRSPDTYLNL